MTALLQANAVGGPQESGGALFVYFGTYTGQKSKGIYRARFDSSTGQLTPAELAAETRNPTFLALSPDRRFLYAVNEITDYGNANSGALSGFRVEPKSGNLTFLNQQASGGAGPCHLAVAGDGKCVLVANYVSGSVAVLPIEEDGTLRPSSCQIQHHGSSVNPQRQEGPHAHFITWDPTGQFVLACDLGLDKVLFYQLDHRLVLSPHSPPAFQVKAGSGPRHIAFGKNGRFAYLLNEISSTLTVCSYDSSKGQLHEIETVSALPADFQGVNTSAEVQVGRTGRFVYASNRGHNSITVFAIDEATGRPRLVQDQSTQGRTPRHFTLDPTGRWLLAENQDSNNIVVFAVDTGTGRLTPTGTSLNLGAPVCSVFLPQSSD
jgi:6-phosphogluconolactonase